MFRMKINYIVYIRDENIYFVVGSIFGEIPTICRRDYKSFNPPYPLPSPLNPLS